MVALGSVAGSAPDTEDSGGDALWTPGSNISPLSNRKNPGSKKKRKEICGQVMLNIGEELLEKSELGLSKKNWEAWATETYQIPIRRLKKLLLAAQSGVLKTRVNNINLKRTRCINNGRGKAGEDNGGGLPPATMGCRSVGGGRPDGFKHIKFRVKRWLAVQRSRCHHVEHMEVVKVYRDELACEIEAASAELQNILLQEAKRKMPVVEKQAHEEKPSGNKRKVIEVVAETAIEVVAEGYEALEEVTRVEGMNKQQLIDWLNLMETRATKLSSDKYCRDFNRSLLNSIDETVLLKPPRLTNLSEEDEAMRVKLGWKLWNHKLWIAAFGTASQLQNMVQFVEPFMQNRPQLVIGISDQIAIWIRIGREEQKITKKWEVKQLDGGKKGQVSEEPFLPCNETEGKATPETFRLTYEARQIITNFFDASKKPEGFLWKGALIVKGAHGRLHNISPEGNKQTLKNNQTPVT
jgi:hypothetical protein